MVYNHREDFGSWEGGGMCAAERQDPEPEARSAMTVGRLSDPAERTRTVKASERVAQLIVGDIVEMGMQTGDRLPLESAMVDQYRVSRTSLREALRLLEVQGLIWLKPGPGGGPVVGTVEPSHLARTAALYFHLGAATYGELMRTQVHLEPLCATLAAMHPDRADRLASYLAHDAPGALESYRDLTTGFHDVVYQLAANPVLSLLTQAVTHIVTHHVILTMDPIELRLVILDEHAELARVIIDGDAAEAHRLMAGHFQRQHDHLRAHWPARLDELIQWR
jgi:DNA-binding FadR family transcriptional regulator